MRLIRFGNSGAERPGLWKDGRIVDLRQHFPEMPDIGEPFFRDGWIQKIAGLADEGHPMDVRLGPPVARPSKLICLGKNYLEHAQEGNFEAPEKPLLFAKAPSALSGPKDPIILPRSCGQVDWEVELALVVGREGKRISRDRAWDYIAGYAVMNDVSGREAQFGDGQWFRGKSFDTFAPLGPALVTPDEIPDIRNLQLTAMVDDQVMQTGNTCDLVFDIPHLMAYISEDITLLPGDVISTGTPAGVGIFRTPPITLAAGNVVTCRIDMLGELVNTVVAPV
ncbi:MAG: fumarylacetoacetate hydrolase family protein [Desulfobacteraceae bacterium]|nr:fumarylacetoacetate hydrolase family protein [Desulfobacteraceae bacterium]MBC2749690.1 fumarylacetoacetate hydrolase family protein [Desulfobacteraceae bacterium]